MNLELPLFLLGQRHGIVPRHLRHQRQSQDLARLVVAENFAAPDHFLEIHQQ